MTGRSGPRRPQQLSLDKAPGCASRSHHASITIAAMSAIPLLRYRAWCPGLFAVLLAACASAGSDAPAVTVTKPDVQDVSMPLRDLAKLPVFEIATRAHEAEPARPLPHMRVSGLVAEHDPVVQSAIGAAAIPTTSVTFEG